MKITIIKYIMSLCLAALPVMIGYCQIIPNGQTTPAASNQSVQPVPSAYGTSFYVNSIRTWQPSKPLMHPENVMSTGRTVQEVRLENQYIDGLGRVVQVVNKGVSSSGKDLVFPSVYNNMGRLQFDYMPYTASSTDGAFKTDPFTDQATFLKSIYNPSNHANGEKFFYGIINYETAPIGRITKTTAPGNSWAGSARGVSKSYEINSANEVVIWTIADSEGAMPVSGGFYPAGQIFRDIVVDEEGKMTVEYKDKHDKVICKKTQLTATQTATHAGWLCTYFVYDSYDNLRCIIPPKAVEFAAGASWSFTSNPAVFQNLCFWYMYDAKGRVKIEKEPGAGAVKMVYDALDRLVMIQDSVQQGQGKWLVNKYDVYNRLLTTYLWTNSQSRSAHESAAVGDSSYPTLSGTYDVLLENYYDNYNWVATSGSGLPSVFTAAEASGGFMPASNDSAPFPRSLTVDYNVKGLITGNRCRVMGTTTFLHTVTFYDSKGRVIQAQQKNITGGIDKVTTQYSFDGKILVMKENLNAPGKTPANVVVLTTNVYDHVGRISEVKKKINSDPEVTIVRNTYNEAGDLLLKKIGQKKIDNAYSTDPVESQDHAYNIRGWLAAINKGYVDNAATARQFGMEISYDYGFSAPSSGYFTGNIAGTRWRSAGDNELRAYGYGYDPTKRLLKADFTQYTGAWNTSAGIDYSMKLGDGTNASTAYDPNGNILKMEHKGWKPGGSVTVDSLLYTYTANSNQLKNVIDLKNDTATRLGDFRSSKTYMTELANNKTIAAVDYQYDGNGNMVKDRNKDVGNSANNGINHNFLNLPDQITFRGAGGAVKGAIAFTYDATGKKLKKVIQEPGKPDKTALYIGGFLYLNDTLQYLAHQEGQIRYMPAVGSNPAGFQYDYFLKDYLGNVRQVVTEAISNDAYPQLTFEGATGTAEVVQQNTYWENKDGLSINVTGSRTARPAAFGTSNSNGSFSFLIRKSTGAIGATKLLKVMSGDRIHTSVEYFYTIANANNTPANGIGSLITSLANALITTSAVPGLIKGQPALVTAPLQSNTDIINLLNKPANTSGTNQAPKAYLNILFFDEQFKFDKDNSQVIPVAYLPNQKGTIDKRLANSLPVKKSGYVYLYYSNESDELVYFDNFMLTHERGRLLQEAHYYPYGLLMAGISGKSFGNKGNKFLYNSKEMQSGEFASGEGLEWYDYGARMYDPQIGRWHTPDPLSKNYADWAPYHYAADNPALFVDPDGKQWVLWLEIDENNNLVFTLEFTGVIYNSSKRRYNAKMFEQRMREDIERVYTTKIHNSDGTTTSSTIKVNLRTVNSIQDIKDTDHIIEIVDPNFEGIFTGGNEEAYGRTPFGQLRVYININNVDRMMNKQVDPNTGPHELGHSAGLIHPEDYSYGVPFFDKWSHSEQQLDFSNQDNQKNFMLSTTSMKDFGVSQNAATAITTTQLQLMHKNYQAGKLNRETNFNYHYRLVGPAGITVTRGSLRYPKK